VRHPDPDPLKKTCRREKPTVMQNMMQQIIGNRETSRHHYGFDYHEWSRLTI